MATNISRNWTLETPMLEVRARGGSAQVGNNIYVMGGSNGAVISGVMRAKIDSDGHVRDWVTDRPLPTALQLGTGFSANGFVYHAGGLAGPTANIYGSKAGPDGSLGPWQVLAMPVGLQQQTHLVVDDRWLYVFGGQNVTSTTAFCWVTDLRSDGSFGPWRRLQDVPSGVNAQSRAVSYGGYVYLSLGTDGGSPGVGVTTVYSARVFGDGSLGPWTPVGAFTETRVRAASFLVDDLWVIAGGALAPLNPGTTPTGTVRTVRLSGGGQVVGISQDPGATLPLPTYTPFQAQQGRFLYVLGGNTNSTTRTSAVQRLELDR